MQGVKPSLIFILDVPTNVGLDKEIEGGRFSEKGVSYHEKVRQGYLEFARRNEQNCVVIEYQEGKPEEVHKKIIKEINLRFK
jgi:dTMP kinase